MILEALVLILTGGTPVGVSCQRFDSAIYPPGEANVTLRPGEAQRLMNELAESIDMAAPTVGGAYVFFEADGVFIEWVRGEFLCSYEAIPKELYDQAFRTAIGQDL